MYICLLLCSLLYHNTKPLTYFVKIMHQDHTIANQLIALVKYIKHKDVQSLFENRLLYSRVFNLWC